MEKKTKKTGRFLGVLDLLILALLAAGVILAVKFSVPAAAADHGGRDLIFVVELQKKEQSFADAAKAGEGLYENLKGIYLGEVTEVAVEQYKAPSPDFTTKTKRDAAVDGLYNVYLTVSAKAEAGPNATVVNGYEIAVGKEMFVRTRSVASPAYCVKMEWGDK